MPAMLYLAPLRGPWDMVPPYFFLTIFGIALWLVGVVLTAVILVRRFELSRLRAIGLAATIPLTLVLLLQCVVVGLEPFVSDQPWEGANVLMIFLWLLFSSFLINCALWPRRGMVRRRSTGEEHEREWTHKGQADRPQDIR